MEDKFRKYCSNTLASCGNQSIFELNGTGEGMIFLKVFKGGSFNYVFAFSGIIDSTFADGSVSKCNDKTSGWTIDSLEAAVCDVCDPEQAEKESFAQLTFGGKSSLTVGDENLYFTDAKSITTDKGQFICLKIKFSGKRLPYHPESIIALYRRNENGWGQSVNLPVPVFTGVEREVKNRIAFIGDSITQGIGSVWNSYKHYAACTAELLGDENAYWDMGIGYARGADMASKGIWLEKAKQNDIVSVCYGVNDMFRGRTVEQLKADLDTILTELKSAGCKVVMQTVPPFDYGGEHEKMWREVNDFIRNSLAPKADVFFDNNPILCGNGKDSPDAKYGGHPNNEGHRLWAEALAPAIKSLL